MERAYTVKEIDQLRRVCDLRYLCGTSNPPKDYMSRQYNESVKTTAVEEMVRTFMLAGITAEDILKEDNPNWGKDNQQ